MDAEDVRRETKLSSCSFKKQFSHSLGCSLVEDLLLEGIGLGEAKSNLVGGELVVAMGNTGESVQHNLSVEWVEEDSLVLSSVSGDSGVSSSDGGWEALCKGIISK